jgi:hypothetical protein
MQCIFVIGALALAATGWSQSAQSTEPQSPTQTFKASPGQAFYVDLDTAPGAFSQWRHDDMASLDGLQAILHVPRIRKDGKWLPTFTIYLRNKDHQTLANDLGVQLVAMGGQLPLKVQLVGHVDGKRIQEIALPTTVNLNEELKLEVTWATPQVVIFKVGSTEVPAVRIAWTVDSVVVTGSTGELKIDPLLFGTVAP